MFELTDFGYFPGKASAPGMAVRLGWPALQLVLIGTGLFWKILLNELNPGLTFFFGFPGNLPVDGYNVQMIKFLLFSSLLFTEMVYEGGYYRAILAVSWFR